MTPQEIEIKMFLQLLEEAHCGNCNHVNPMIGQGECRIKSKPQPGWEIITGKELCYKWEMK